MLSSVNTTLKKKKTFLSCFISPLAVNFKQKRLWWCNITLIQAVKHKMATSASTVATKVTYLFKTQSCSRFLTDYTFLFSFSSRVSFLMVSVICELTTSAGNTVVVLPMCSRACVSRSINLQANSGILGVGVAKTALRCM